MLYKEKRFIQLAVSEAFFGMRKGEGGPFGAVIILDGDVIASAHNEVLISNDPTAHAEIMAIRRASKKLGRFDLSDCTIYSSCEPCPMCYSAIHWAKIKKLIFGCTKDDAAGIGFDDKFIYDSIRGTTSESRLESINKCRNLCLPLFEEWDKKTDKVRY